MKAFLSTKKGIIIAIAVVIVIGGIIVYRSTRSTSSLETTTATSTTVTELVSVTGKVVPFERVDLGFEKGGTVKSVNVKVGDTVARGQALAAINDSQTYASLLSAEASLDVAKANLTDNNTNSQIDYTNAGRDLANALHDSYITINNSILNTIDPTFFRGGSSVNPTLNFTTNSYAIEQNIEAKRAAVSVALGHWQTDLNNQAADPSVLATNAHGYLSTIQTFLTALGGSVSDFVRDNPNGLSTNTSYLAAMNTANADQNNAVSTLTSAENKLLSMTPKSTESLQARIAQAQADVANYQAQFDKSRVLAPFSGLISRVDPTPGDLVTAGQTLFSLMADQSFKVEVNIPEADIAKVAVGNLASITLDAYGDEVVFPASVIMIDPAETIVEGVPTYKVSLQFDKKDDRIRSGMTANIDIVTNSKPNVVAVPFRAVVNDSNTNSVRVVNADHKTWHLVPVTLGLKGSDGLVEITSGLQAGAEIVTFVK